MICDAVKLSTRRSIFLPSLLISFPGGTSSCHGKDECYETLPSSRYLGKEHTASLYFGHGGPICWYIYYDHTCLGESLYSCRGANSRALPIWSSSRFPQYLA